MRLAFGVTSGNSCEKVGQGAGWLQRVWQLEWGRTWIPLRLQLGVNGACNCEGLDVVDVNVGICSLCPLPVSRIQKLLGEERTARRQAAAARSRRRKALRLLYLCNAERAGCAGKQRRYVSTSNASISSTICQDAP